MTGAKTERTRLRPCKLTYGFFLMEEEFRERTRFETQLPRGDSSFEAAGHSLA